MSTRTCAQVAIDTIAYDFTLFVFTPYCYSFIPNNNNPLANLVLCVSLSASSILLDSHLYDYVMQCDQKHYKVLVSGCANDLET